MEHVNVRGERRAAVEFGRLKDLWFMWSLCNLECTHCYVASSPRNHTLELLRLEDIRPFLLEAAELGVEHTYFTGGEPFANKQILPMIRAAAELARVTILTNGVGPIARHLEALEEFKDRLTLRISLDHFERDRHDAIRGTGSFDATLTTIRELCRRGFVPVITATPVVFENTPITLKEAVLAFQRLFEGLEVAIKVLPTTLSMGAEISRRGPAAPVPFISERRMNGANPADFQCHTSRCIQKIDGRIRVYPCPIIYNDPAFELGSTLRESMRRVYLAHHGCVNFCFKHRGKCGDEQLAASQRGM